VLEDRDVRGGVREAGGQRREVRGEVEVATVGHGEGGQERLVGCREKG